MTFAANNTGASSGCHRSDQEERQQSSSQRPVSRDRVNNSLLQLLMDGQHIMHGSMEGSAVTLVNLQTQARPCSVVVRSLFSIYQELTSLGNYDGCGIRSLEEILQEAIHILQDVEEEPGEYYPFEQ